MGKADRSGRLAEACPDAELLAAYADENVTPEERQMIDAHLVCCDQCAEVVAFAIACKSLIPDSTPPRNHSS
jgi:anti-sigma factor ChrR (cupin superfamily)